ncbi:hypothetical protein DACRYDRAFT_102743 [Dacryopinax primogenitus]|uniref:PIN domain-containing protein n=1 Tax=Dacryopinax primogenitus (strain DJM 731) TaxID=1858805 RepID=M5FQ99_DACPD|nr:uncharacterized protein DACRYDRAFT_102743 [Dacryopinax primogenitus]EJT96834.1 hypothetical protein DACRYDRAFT_102743 [Dacryopinax primogenitus]
MSDPLGVLDDEPGPSRRRRGEPLDLHERMILAQRQKNRDRATKQREDRRTPEPSSPQAPPPPLPPYPPQLLSSPRQPVRPPPPQARPPPPVPRKDPYARGAPAGRLFDPASDPIPVAPPAPITGTPIAPGMAAGAGAGLGVGVGTHGRPLPAPPRGYTQPQPPPPPSFSPAHTNAHSPAQHSRLFDPSRDDPLRFSVLNRGHAAPAPSLPPSQPNTSILPPIPPSLSSTPMGPRSQAISRNAVLSGISNGTSSSLSQSLLGSSATGTTGTTGHTSSSVLLSTPATSNYLSGLVLPPGALVGPHAKGVIPMPPPSAYSGSAGSVAYTSASSVSTESSIHLSAPLRSERSGDSARNGLVVKMKKLYENITERERECERVLGRVEDLAQEAGFGREARRLGKEREWAVSREEMEMERRWWFSVVDYHEELADAHHAMFKIGLHPLTAGALEKVIARYNLPTRLWQRVWHLLRVLVDRARSPNPPPLPTSLTKEPISTFRSRLTPEQVSSMSPWARPNPPKRPASTHLHLTPRLVAAELVQVAFAWAWELYAVLWEQRTIVHVEQINLSVCWSEAMGDLARFRMVWAKERENDVAPLLVASESGSVGSRSAFSAPSARGHLDEDEYGEEDGEGEGDGDVDMDEDEDHMSLDASSGRLLQPQPRHSQFPRKPLRSSNLQRLTTPNNAASASHRPFPLLSQSPNLPSHSPLNAFVNSHAAPVMVPSIGMGAVALWPPILDTEVWRNVAQEWYWRGLGEMPGVGRLQHHLGLLAQAAQTEGSNALEGTEARVAYHFLKSLTSSQPHVTARESVLSLFSVDKQRARAAPDATTSELFVLLHGILYTRVQLDDFAPTKARLDERLRIELSDMDTAGNVSESEWIMWGVMCLAACAEYGREEGVIKKAEGRLRKMDKEDADEDMEDVVDGVAALTADTSQDTEPFPLTFRLALKFTFDLLAIVLEHPYHLAPPYYTPHLNPFIVMMFTYLSTIAKSSKAMTIVERYVPWEQLARFVQGHVQRMSLGDHERAAKLRAEKPNSGGILPEDWALRGMDWVTRRVYQKGFWDKRPPKPEIVYDAKGRPTIKGVAHELVSGESDVLALGVESAFSSPSAPVSELVRDGIVEDESENMRDAWIDLAKRRWKRVMGASAMLEKRIRGWQWEDGRGWVVGGELGDKLAAWREEDEREQREKEEEERRLRNRACNDDMEADQQIPIAEADDEIDGEVDEVVQALLVQRTSLRDQLDSQQRLLVGRAARSTSYPPISKPARAAPLSRVRRDLQVERGYTILVLDTNVLITSLLQVQNLIEGLRWTVVLPLPVLAELDGLRSHPRLSDMATLALEYIKSHVRTHSKSLKVQTSKGNYLSNLAVTTEVLDFSGAARNIDGLILDAAAWQLDHFVDRTAILATNDEMVSEPTEQTSKVVLLTFDRNMRLRARSRQLDVASPNEVAAILLSD